MIWRFELEDRLTTLYDHALPSFRTGVFFNTYAYPTKITPESIAIYIATHTRPGDTVLDAFSGSGATGLAALMCEHPTSDMEDIAKKLGVQPEWGARNACLYDISTYGTFAARVMTDPPKAKDFKRAAESLLETVSNELGWMYETEDSSGNKGRIRHIVWSSVLVCPKCGKEFAYYDGMVSWNPLAINSVGTCPHCGQQIAASECAYVTDNFWDCLLGKEVCQRRRQPMLVYGETGSKRWRRQANASDFDQIRRVNEIAYNSDIEPQEIKWGELRRSGYHFGMTHLHHFYTKRNYLIIEALWRASEAFENKMRDALRLLILSYNATHSTLMTRVVVKHNSHDFVLTGAQSGVLYVSNLPVEKNILKGLARKIKPFMRAFDYVGKCTGQVVIHNQSSSNMAEERGSIDYTFTDPPFGDFIPYAEVNQINELWLGRTTDRNDEAIVSPSQGKGIDDYGNMLESSLREAARVLKDDGLMTLVFHSSKAEIWQVMAKAIKAAGLTVRATSHLAKVQDSFKQVVSSSSVKNDSLILLSKDKGDSESVSRMHGASDPYSSMDDPRAVYAAYVNDCLERGVPVEMDAREAYERLALTGALR